MKLSRFLFACFLVFCATITVAQAQSLDVKLDSSLSSGMLIGPANSEISVVRAPLLLDFDVAFTFDKDPSLEWVLGTMVQLENLPAFALNPQVRLKRQKGPFEGFAGLGVPFFLTPYTRVGTELSLGFSFPARTSLAFVANINARTYLLGSDLPEDSPVITLTGAVGIRLCF